METMPANSAPTLDGSVLPVPRDDIFSDLLRKLDAVDLPVSDRQRANHA